MKIKDILNQLSEYDQDLDVVFEYPDYVSHEDGRLRFNKTTNYTLFEDRTRSSDKKSLRISVS